jgi:capsular polysaccharide export protein
MNFIALYIGSNDEFLFFSRLHEAFRKKGYEFIFLSNKISIIIKLILSGQKFHLVRKSELPVVVPDLSRCFDCRIKFMNNEEAAILYSSVFNAFNLIAQEIIINYIFIWNGLSIQTLAAGEFSKTRGIKARYFELANLPSKLFVNPKGVNAASSLFYDISILNNYNISEDEYVCWKDRYLREKKNFKPVSGFGKINNYLFLLDVLAFKYFDIPGNGEIKINKKLKNFISQKRQITYDDYELADNRYIFLPLQVEYDTQLIFNSDISSLKAIHIAAERAAELNADLVIKIHPAEFDNEFITKVLILKSSLNFILVNYCTIELIINALLVITINSTVGLEAKILGKKVEFLGKSFYALLDKGLLKNYITGYLLSAGYNSKDKIPQEVVEHILTIK